ncbi:MAG: ribosome-binding factor A [Polyangiaceae bacterium]
MANSGKRKGSRRPRERSYFDPSDPSSAPAQGHRIDRLEHVIRDELASILRDEASNPRLDPVRIRRVELSVDYRNARVWFAAPDPIRPIEIALEQATPFLRARLAELLDLKRVPNLRFLLDRSADGLDAHEPADPATHETHTTNDDELEQELDDEHNESGWRE